MDRGKMLAGSHYETEELTNKNGYSISIPYRDGELIRTKDPYWNFEILREICEVICPQEFKHTLQLFLIH